MMGHKPNIKKVLKVNTDNILVKYTYIVTL